MVTLLISGSGTSVGKTRIMGALARAAGERGRSVQLIKPVQTGVATGEPLDADIAKELAGVSSTTAMTLRSYSAALAPIAAARMEGIRLDPLELAKETLAQPSVDLRLIEGAGGLAVPLQSPGWDWVDFALAARVNAVVLVVPDQLGAINWARLAHHYLVSKSGSRLRAGIFLNGIEAVSPEVKSSTRAALNELGIPVWGELAANFTEAKLHPTLVELIGA